MGSTKPLRLIQHKKEALWFYSFISFGYDHVFNPGQYTDDMRDMSLWHARLHSRALKVVDVGGGTGFTTLGVVRYVDPENVTLLDQSPHQLDKARKKEALRGIKIMEGDAEDLPFPTDTFDRYVSAGRVLCHRHQDTERGLPLAAWSEGRGRQQATCEPHFRLLSVPRRDNMRHVLLPGAYLHVDQGQDCAPRQAHLTKDAAWQEETRLESISDLSHENIPLLFHVVLCIIDMWTCMRDHQKTDRSMAPCINRCRGKCSRKWETDRSEDKPAYISLFDLS